MLLRVTRMLAFYAALLGLWQLLAMSEIWSPYLFPSPGSVFDSLWKNIENNLIIDALQISLKRLAIGYALSFTLGMGIGITTGAVRWVDDTLGSLVLGLQSLPSITWLPLAILWFGLNDQAIIFVVLMGSVFAISISARAGVRSIPPLLRRAAQTFGAGRWQTYRYVVLPGMLPAMVQGLKLGWSFAWRSLMAGELLFVSMGLGHLLDLGRNLNDMSLVVAVMLVIIAVGLSVDRLIFGHVESWVQERWGLARV
jgi:NitT/TauT family transport system permease protein